MSPQSPPLSVFYIMRGVGGRRVFYKLVPYALRRFGNITLESKKRCSDAGKKPSESSVEQ